MTIDLSCATRWVTIGFERENLARAQEFDFSAWAEEHGSGVPQLLFQRPGEDTPYPVLLDVSGTTATWTPSATDTAIAGEGKAQLSYTVDEVVVKNAIFAVLISPSLGASGDPPEGFETWLEELTELAADAQAAAIAAGESETDAEAAATAAGNAQTAAEAAQLAAETAQGKAETAQEKAEQAQAMAEAAQGAAETAQGKAETAQGKAETAQGKAETAQGKAETAQGKAETAQTKAETAQAKAEAAQAAIEDMTATASVADNTPGTPSVAVTKSTIAGHENLDFVFSHVKGAKGDTGAQGIQGPTGPEGPRGYDGYSPTVAVTDISGGHRVTITDKNGDHSFDVMDGDVSDLDAGDVSYDGTETYPADTVGSEISSVKSALNSKIDDVQVNGTSVVADGVANVPVASSSVIGAVKAGTGMTMSNGAILLATPTDAMLKGGSQSSYAISPYVQHKSAFYALAKAAGDSTQSSSANAVGTYTESAKSAIAQMLDAPETVSGTTPTIAAKAGVRYVCGECATLTITTPASGIVDVIFQSGSTPTVLTVTPPTGMTMHWAGGFDPTALEANTVYELNIMDGCYGVCASWT